MRAFTEHLCDHVLIVRAGPLAERFGDPFVSSCMGSKDGKIVTLKAYAESPTPEMTKAAARAILADGFEEVHLDRAGQNPRRLVFTKGENGEIRMSKVKKEAIRPVKDIFKADGTLNVPEATFGLAHAMGQDAAGHISITHGSATEHANADGSVDVVIKFKRNHH